MLDVGHVGVEERLGVREAAVAARDVGRRQREQHAPVRRRRGPEVLRVREAQREGEARAPRHGDAELVAVVDPRLADRAVDACDEGVTATSPPSTR